MEVINIYMHKTTQTMYISGEIGNTGGAKIDSIYLYVAVLSGLQIKQAVALKSYITACIKRPSQLSPTDLPRSQDTNRRQ